MKFKYHYILFLSIIFLLANGYTGAQAPVWAWAQSFGSPQGGNSGRAIAVDPVVGDVYTTGNFTGSIKFDVSDNTQWLEAHVTNSFITKMDRDGNLLWAKSLEGGSNYSTAVEYAADESGSIYVLGYFQDTVDFDPGPAVFELVAGNGTNSVYLTKLDANGHFIWAKQILSTFSAHGSSIEIISSGQQKGICIVGSFLESIDADPGEDSYLLSASSLFYTDAFVIKLDLDGQFLWAKSFGGGLQDECIGITSDIKGDLYIIGIFRDTVNFDPAGTGGNVHISSSQRSVFLLNLNEDGKVQWSKSWGGTSAILPEVINNDKYGHSGIYITGSFAGTGDFDPDPLKNYYETSNGSHDVFITRLDLDGRHLWTKTVGGLHGDRGWDITPDPCGSGNVILTGQWEEDIDFDPGPGVFQVTVEDNATCIFVMSLDQSGNFLWVKPVGNGDGDGSNALASDHAGNIYIAGALNSKSINFDTILLIDSNPNYSGHDILIARLGIYENVSGSDIDSITIYPIPAKSELTIDFHGTRCEEVEIALYTMIGQLIYTERHDILNGKVYVDISQFPAATYALELRYNGKSRVEKAIKL